MKSKFLFSLIFLLSLFCSLSFAEQYNQNGDFAIEVDSLKQRVIGENIDAQFDFIIKNNNIIPQDILIKFEEKPGWIITIAEKEFELGSNEEKKLTLRLRTTSDFDYSESVISPELIKISQQENYIGTFEFPVTIAGDNENVNLRFTLDIQDKEKLNEVYNAEFATEAVSPQKPLGFAIKAENLNEEQKVGISLQFATEQYNYDDIFSSKNNYKIYSQSIPSSIPPGEYFARITIRLEKDNGEVAWEWKKESNIVVEEYRKISTREGINKTFLKDTYTISATNLGNVDETYSYETEIGIFKRMLLSSNSNYTNEDNNVTFTTPIAKGETKEVRYSFNYIPVYLVIVVVIIIISYIYIRKTSNPLDVETKIYEIKTVQHEGVKSMKMRIGFENIKEEEIENLKMIFRMPSYLNVENNSFLLREPNHALKGKNQYKLIWDFKRFEQNDSRILGFTLVNKRGILGDIKIPDIEFELKINGKIKRYFKSLPVIKG